MFKDVRIIVFLIWCLLIGAFTSIIWNFYFWLVEERSKDHSNSQEWLNSLEGLLMSVRTILGELPFFFISGYIIKKIGHIYSMHLIFLVLGIRFILYSVITNPWWYIPVELTSGLTFGLMYTTMTSYAFIIAPEGASTTVQVLKSIDCF